MSETPTLQDIITSAINSRVGRIHTAIPGKVLSYDSSTQTATIKPSVQAAFRLPGGDVEQFDLPNISDVPILFPASTVGNFSITFPISAGDQVVLVLQERSTEEWRATTEDSNTPQDLRRFDLSDAVAIPAGSSPSSSIPAAGIDGSAMVLQGSSIKLGSSSASDFIALSTSTDAIASSIKAAATGAVDGDAFRVAVAALSFASTAAAKVKAE